MHSRLQGLPHRHHLRYLQPWLLPLGRRHSMSALCHSYCSRGSGRVGSAVSERVLGLLDRGLQQLPGYMQCPNLAIRLSTGRWPSASRPAWPAPPTTPPSAPPASAGTSTSEDPVWAAPIPTPWPALPRISAFPTLAKEAMLLATTQLTALMGVSVSPAPHTADSASKLVLENATLKVVTPAAFN